MSAELLNMALGYDVDVGPPSRPVEVPTRYHVDHVDPQPTGRPTDRARECVHVPTQAVVSTLDTALAPLALGLLRLRTLHGPISALQDAFRRDLKGAAKKALHEQLEIHASRADDDAPAGPGGGGGEQQKGAKTVMAHLRDLHPDAFDAVMVGVVVPMGVVLRRAAAVHATLIRVAEEGAKAAAAGEGGEGGGEGGEGGKGGRLDAAAAAYAKEVESAATGMLHATCELAHERYARLLKVRKEVHERLPLEQFVHVSEAAMEFVRDVRHVSGAPAHALTAEVSAQARMPARFTATTGVTVMPL